MSKLKLGLIPQGTDCPFALRCSFKAEGTCKHQGVKHTVDFSCASARGFDLLEKYRRETKPIV